MSDLRERCSAVLAIALVALLADIVVAMAGVLGQLAAAMGGGISVVVAATAVTLLWASNGEQGVGTW